ncbi:MAG TPA: thioredoxin [Clostridia bacterium]|jgi:thioredoxin 1|nr:thioredoxin [Clostridia bacterium]
MSIVQVSASNFKEEVLDADKPVLVDFWAAWCGPCRMIAPVVEQIAEEYNGKLKVAKLNVDENPSIASQYEVMSIPTLFVFKDGDVASRLIGYMPKDRLKQAIDQVL